MRKIKHTKNTSPFDYSEYKEEPIISIDWFAVTVMIVFAAAFVGVLFSL